MTCERCGLRNGQHADQCPRPSDSEAIRQALDTTDLREAEALVVAMEQRTRLWFGFFLVGVLVGIPIGAVLGWVLG